MSPGWVYLNQRPTVPHIVNGLSIPENNLKWKDEFVYLLWEGGDWGTLFRQTFTRVMDGSPDEIQLSPEEQQAYDVLTTDNGTTHAWFLLKESSLREVGLSPVSEKGNQFLFFF